MSGARSHRLLIFGCLVAVSVSACRSSTPVATDPTPTPAASTTAASTTTPSTTTPESPAVRVSVAADGAIRMPGELSSSGYVFEISSAAPAMVTLLQTKRGYTKSQLVMDLGPHSDEAAAVSAANRFDTSVRAFGGAWSGPGSPGVFARMLDSGTYWLVDLAREPQVENVHTLTVTGSTLTTHLPEANAIASATSGRAWNVPKSLPAKGTLLIRNQTLGTHQLVVEAVPASSTSEAYLSATRMGRGISAPGTIPGPSPVSAGVEFLWTYDLPPGDYIVMDLSVSEHGLRQYAGAGAILVSLTNR